MQNTDKHTIAPWVLTEANTSIPIKGANGKTVCSIAFRDNDLDDARLIAAAPDMLNALEQTLICLRDPNQENVNALERLIESAITKARGE